MKHLRLTSLSALCALASAGSLHATVLMLDFGTASTVSGAALTNSPYHGVNTSFTDTTWNGVGADFMSGLKWSDGTDATGLSVNLGSSVALTGGAGSLDIAGAVNAGSVTGSIVNGGVFTSPSVGSDAIFANGASSSNSRAVGLQVGGLAAGTYTIYLTARNTNSASAQTVGFFVGTSSSAGNFNISIDGSSPNIANALYSAAGGSTEPSWSQGSNYQSISITLAAGEYLNIASLGVSGDKRGFLNSVQIVSAIPEPSSFALLGGAAALGLVGLRRRRRA